MAEPTKNSGPKVVTAKGVTTSLGSFVESLFGMKAQPPPSDGDEAIRQQRVALEALEEIADSIERGEDLKAADVANLLPVHLDNLKRHGDAAMLKMISDLECDRDREGIYGRER